MANGLLDKRNDYLSINDYMSAYDDGIAFNEVEVISTPFITYVDSNFFKQFEKLEKVNLPNLRSLPSEAFSGCSKLKEAHFINMNYISGARVFNNCINLSKITFSKELNIGPYAYQAFCSCYKLESIPYIVANGGIPENAFCDCSSLKRISAYCSSGIVYIKDHAFYGCVNLIEASFNNFYGISSHAFHNCKKMFNISIPNVTVISQYAFANCEALEFIDLPECENIYASAFYGCSNLISISTPLVRWLAAAGYVFENCNKLKTLSFPRFTSLPSAKIASNCQNLKSIYFDNVVSIGSSGIALDYTGNYDVVLNKIQDLPSAIAINNNSIYITNLVCNGVTSVSRISAYYNVYSKLYVSNLYINNCKYIYSKAFESAQFINIHAEKCKEIYSYAFSACSNLEGLNFPNCILMSEPILYGSYPNIKYLNFENIISLYNDGFFSTTTNNSSYGSLSYMNFHNLIRAGAAFLGCANVISDVFIDLTNCIDFNFIQGSLSNVQHYINNLTLPNLTEISATNFNSEQIKYFIGYTPSSSSWWWDIPKYSYVNVMQLSVKNLYLNNLTKIHYSLYSKTDPYASSKYSAILNVYVSSELYSGYNIWNILSSSYLYSLRYWISPIHNIENLYAPECKTFRIDMVPTRIYTHISTYSACFYTFIMTDYLDKLESIYIPKCEHISAMFTNSSIAINLPNVLDGFIGIANNRSSNINIGSNFSGEIRLNNISDLTSFNVNKAKYIDLEFLPTLERLNVENVNELNKLVILDTPNISEFNFKQCSFISNLKNIPQYTDDRNITASHRDFYDILIFIRNSDRYYMDNVDTVSLPILSRYDMWIETSGSMFYDTTLFRFAAFAKKNLYIPKLSSFNIMSYNSISYGPYSGFMYNDDQNIELQAENIVLGLNNIRTHGMTMEGYITFNFRKAINVELLGESININVAKYNYSTFIGPSPFSSLLQTLNIPNLISIDSLGLAFTSYSSSIYISNFSESLFDENLGLTRLTFPKLSYIGYRGMYKLMNLEYLSIENCTILGSYALNGCPKLSYLYLPNISQIYPGGLPSNIKILKLGSSFVYPSQSFNITTGINSDIEKFLQVPESMYSQYSNHSAWQSIFNNHDSYKWNLIAY